MSSARSIYLINPAADFPTYYGAEVYAGRGYQRAAFLADLVVPTLAAMVPPDWHVELCDEHLEEVNWDTPCEYVGLTGKVSQWGRTVAIADRFRERGKTVLIGGPHASLSPERVRPHCDILVRDEIELIVDELFADLANRQWKEEYVGGRPDLAHTPVPRWDLYRKYNHRVLTATLQTARGCPFECEFCDVIQYVGRKQRHKPIDRIVEELQVIHDNGYRSVLLADDNTTANKRWCKEMLAAVRDWNLADGRRKISFSTQISIDAAMDDELLSLAASAGMTHVFIGVETPNEESLEITRKRQNLPQHLRNPHQEHPTLVDQIHRFYAHGIGVTAGMICGFDGDRTDIFERQFEFAMQGLFPVATLSALAAPHATPLNARLAKAGRLVTGHEVPGHPWTSNTVPKLMSRDELTEGIRWLANRLYHPQHFGERLVGYIEKLRFSPEAVEHSRTRHEAIRTVDRDTLSLIADIPRLDAESQKMWDRVTKALPSNPPARVPVLEALIRYQQLRYMYEQGRFWDEVTEASATAPFGAT